MSEQLNYNIVIGGNAYASLGEIKKALKDSNNELIAAQQNFGEYSKEAVAAAKKIALLKDSIQEARETSDLFDPGKKFQALSGTLTAVAGGFAAVQGAIGLVGGESKELEKQLLKVQSALALSQGLSTITDSVKDFQRLGAVIKSTTAFRYADVTATRLAIKTQNFFTGAVNATSLSFKALKAAIASTGILLLVVAIGELVSALMNYTSSADKAAEKQKELNEQIAAGEEAANKSVKEFINSQAQLQELRAQLAGKGENEILAIRKKSLQDQIAANDRAYEELIKVDKKKATALKEENAKLQDEITKLELNAQIQRKKNRDESEKKRKEDERIAEKERNDRLRNQILEDNKSFLNTIDKDRKERIKNTDAIVKGGLEANLQSIGALTNARKKAAQDEQDLDNTKLKYEQAKRDSYAMTADALGVLGQVVGQETAVGKVLSSAQALINTFLGITQIWANRTVIPEPFGTIQKVAATTTAAASGFLAVRNINRVQVPKGGGGVSVPSFSAAPLTPSSASLLTTSLSQQTINAIGNSAIRAYVVETDITSNQKRVQAIKQRARFS
jgi:chromosome segregation ATPase